MSAFKEPKRPDEWAGAADWADYHREMAEATLTAAAGTTHPAQLMSAIAALAQVHSQLAIAYELRARRSE